MKSFIHLTKDQQELMPLFDNAFLENKPIPFPNRSGTQAYSNLFYWAHLDASRTAEFPLHPHEGFEIMTFIFEGSLSHYDTVSQKYTPLYAGGVQVTQAGSGVQHSEKMTKGTKLFQIWFDPDFSQTLKKPATYHDYEAKDFSVEVADGIERLAYLKPKGPIYSETPLLSIEKLTLNAGTFTENLDADFTYSYYVLAGDLTLNDVTLKKDDFLRFSKEGLVRYIAEEGAEVFMIKSPTSVGYKRFIERY